jgi:hypothetical protein
MNARRDQRDPDPGNLRGMRDPNNDADNEKNVSENSKHQRGEQTDREHRALNKRGFGLCGHKRGAALEKINQRADYRQQTVEQTAVSRGTAGSRGLVGHSARNLSPENQT